jgi:EmrB/QacA subfamily drug resistance transporter
MPTADAAVTDQHRVDGGGGRWATLGVLCLCLTLVMITNINLNLALPSIAHDLGASTGELQWMVDAYALVFAGLLLTAGTIGDRFGRKGALQTGLALFALGSVLAALSTTSGTLIGARAVIGLGAAFVMPSTLSIITNTFPPDERGRAIAVWSGVAGGAAALGPITSGILLDHFWWGSVLLVNVPVALTAFVAAVRLVPTSRDTERRPVDAAGAALSTVGVSAVVYGIIEGAHHGWTDAATALAFAIGAIALAFFLRHEANARHPMLDLGLFRDRRFSIATSGVGLLYFALFGGFFLLAQFLQLAMRLSPLEAGLLQLPVSLVMIAVSPWAPRLERAIGTRRVVAAGFALVATGMALLSRLDAGSSVWHVVVALVPLAGGIAITSAPLTTLMMSAVPRQQAGSGSAMNSVSRELGGALGVAILGSVLAAQYRDRVASAVRTLAPHAPQHAETSPTATLDTAAALPPADRSAMAAAARESFVDAFSVATTLTAALALVVAALALRVLRHTGSPEPSMQVAGGGESAEPNGRPAR